MSESNQRVSKKAGLPPGTLIHVGKRSSKKVKIRVIDFNLDHYKEIECATIEDCFKFKNTDTVSWVNIDGLHDVETISKIGNHFGIHPLSLEDILNTKHRPKFEEFQDHLFITLKMLGIDKKGKGIVNEQVSFILGENWVLSFQEREGDIFDGLRLRIKENKGSIREKKVDYLLYRLVDTIVDNYFFVTEHFSNISEKLEEKVLINSDQQVLLEIQKQKKQIIGLRRIISPTREAIGSLQKDATALISENTTRYLRDVYEHVIQVNETVEVQRDLLGGIMDLYLTGVSNKMNQIMKVLTIIATIFIPLTFVAGIYGMNFDHMPELHWKWAYYAIWGVMLVIVIVMLIFFRRKKWL